MLENIKLDIIYYGAQKDFEMEFNLCGCCRMRLLTTVAEDLKDFLNCLKVAVSRSRVVLLCGELYGEAGILSIISKAVGRDFEEVENHLYGIAGNGKTRLLKQSIPLVSSSGKLLGCVIEQGPQAIIMISNDKAGRKEIMQNLVHPYVKEKSKFETASDTNLGLVNTESEPDILISPEAQALEVPLETEEEIDEAPIQADTEAEKSELSLGDTNDSAEELETVSLEDFSAKNESATLEVDITREDTDEEFIENDNVLPNNGGLVLPENFDEDEADEAVFDSDIFKKYNEDYSLINPANNRNNHKKGRNRGSSPIILILFCLVLCLIGVMVYFLLVKPAQAGIDIGENFHNLFSFVLKGVYRLW